MSSRTVSRRQSLPVTLPAFIMSRSSPASVDTSAAHIPIQSLRLQLLTKWLCFTSQEHLLVSVDGGQARCTNLSAALSYTVVDRRPCAESVLSIQMCIHTKYMYNCRNEVPPGDIPFVLRPAAYNKSGMHELRSSCVYVELWRSARPRSSRGPMRRVTTRTTISPNHSISFHSREIKLHDKSAPREGLPVGHRKRSAWPRPSWK